jgi:tRNA(Ile)-lysidine synthase
LETGDNLEQAARRVRQGFFLGLIQSGVLDRVALGHTRSDQAETVLFRFLRGAGTAGLAGIRPVTAEGLVRPLIEVGRAEVVQFLRERGVSWREDSSNQDRSFARNRIRHELLPALEREWNPALEGILAGVAKVAQDEEDYWRAVVDEMTEGNLLERPPAVLFRAEWLAGLHPAVARQGQGGSEADRLAACRADSGAYAEPAQFGARPSPRAGRAPFVRMGAAGARGTGGRRLRH